MRKLLIPILILTISLTMLGCGASNGTGYDTPPQTPARSISILEILAVDDRISGADIEIGTALGASGVEDTLNIQSLKTAADGKTSRIDFNLPADTRTLYFQTRGGTSATHTIASTRGFIGVADLPDNTGSHTFERINIHPYSTIVARLKAKNPATGISQLAMEALHPFLQTTKTANININSRDYQGLSTPSVETTANAPLMQLFNEMIKTASNSENGANGAEKVLNLLDRLPSETSSEQGFKSNSVFVNSVSSISSILASTPSSLPNYFSEAVQILSTSSTATVRPSTFVTNPASVIRTFQLSSELRMGTFTAFIGTLSSRIARITSASKDPLVLPTIPDAVVFQRLDTSYAPILESTMSVELKLYDSSVESITDTIDITVEPVHIDASSVFTLIIPTGARIQGSRIQSNGSKASAGSINQSEDRYPSETSTIRIPFEELIRKGENSFGQNFPDLSGRTFDLQVLFGEEVRFEKETTGSVFHGFDVSKGTITP